MKTSTAILLAFALISGAASAQAADDRVTITAQKASRGTTVPIEIDDIINFCSDDDGCEMRVSMHYWDEEHGTRRVASRESLLFVDDETLDWRTSLGDVSGTDGNGRTEHLMHVWACYVTDGDYSGFRNLGDSRASFGLLSYDEYTADCRVTIID